MRKQASFPAVLSALADIAEMVTGCAREAGMAEKCLWEIELAVGEAATNIVSYAYPEEEAGTIEIECRLENERFAIVLRDSGQPFDQTKPTTPVLEGPLEERQIGGYGRFLMRQCLDDLSYAREEGRNVLTFVKRISR